MKSLFNDPTAEDFDTEPLSANERNMFRLALMILLIAFSAIIYALW